MDNIKLSAGFCSSPAATKPSREIPLGVARQTINVPHTFQNAAMKIRLLHFLFG